MRPARGRGALFPRSSESVRPRKRFPRRLAAALTAVGAAMAIAACGSTTSSGGSSHGSAPARPAHPFQTLSAPTGAPPRTVHVPILMYHRVHEYATELTKSVPNLTVEPGQFALEMSALVRNGFHAITQRQLFEALYDGAQLPAKPVLITVDDGYVDDVTQILPVLQRNHMVATFYIISGRFHEAGFVNESQVRQLDEAGMDVGAHTRHHVPLPEFSGSALDSEVAGSKSDLEAVVGHPVYWFAYPFGNFDASVVEAVRRAGFLLAVTTHAGATESTAAPLEMPRMEVGRTATVAQVLDFASGTGVPTASGGE